MPVGSVITWPSGNLPDWMTHGDYLECNGQNFDIAKYPKLYKALGTNRVPNYSGIFLRGYGSRSYSQNNGSQLGITATQYSSDKVGIIQGDAIRKLWLPFRSDATNTWENYQENELNNDKTAYVLSDQYPSIWTRMVYAPAHDGWHLDGHMLEKSTSTNWGDALVKYRYQLIGDKESGYSLKEEKIDPVIRAGISVHGWSVDYSRIVPTSNEIRPVNIAVRYFIKAR